ncbi:hypothetical protein G443_004722 [Actinoalloteichus cyanogriseus DSM 43889]|uniref:Uncharacterized protein n=1 Tax=Actinoalloteichus caeruleus DSM 43889 TaxID=1120930 RepID=A0ABT1JPK9_ACTCY|nr:hypothetical protein [Actinoalloteichus caeruleus DSM 43889]
MATEQGGERLVASPDAVGTVDRRTARSPSLVPREHAVRAPGRRHAPTARREAIHWPSAPAPWSSPARRACPLVGSPEVGSSGGDSAPRRARTSVTAERRPAPPRALLASEPSLPDRASLPSGEGTPPPNTAHPPRKPGPAGSGTTSRTAHPHQPDRRPIRPGGGRPVGTSTRPDSTKDHHAITATVPPTTGATGTTSAVSGCGASRRPCAPGRRARADDLRASGPSWGEPVRVRRGTVISLLRPALRGAAP